ncbi:hypothetical protein TH30_18380 [Thalassospira profundimaris]|uniref:Uncharacterized protein n=1 Tax=Thalassospira profundimaris TaxID=502049 RepID=A0A367WT10_9PROT|nr:hypothetical protein TH30_18380 [Thalassospira profundimaris]
MGVKAGRRCAQIKVVKLNRQFIFTAPDAKTWWLRKGGVEIGIADIITFWPQGGNTLARSGWVT